MHGYFCGKIKFKSVNNNYYVHKTMTPNKQGIEAIKQKQEDIHKKKRKKTYEIFKLKNKTAI